MPVKPAPMADRASSGSRLGDRVFHLLCLAGALTVGLLLLLVLWQLLKGSHLSLQKFGLEVFYQFALESRH